MSLWRDCPRTALFLEWDHPKHLLAGLDQKMEISAQTKDLKMWRIVHAPVIEAPTNGCTHASPVYWCSSAPGMKPRRSLSVSIAGTKVRKSSCLSSSLDTFSKQYILYLKANPDWSLIFIIYLRVRGAKGFGSWKRQMPILHHLQLYSNKGEETWRLEFLACACAHKNLFRRSPNTHEVRALKILIDEESKLCTYILYEERKVEEEIAGCTYHNAFIVSSWQQLQLLHPPHPTHTHTQLEHTS